MAGIDFAQFYKAVHGRMPFPWQERLAARALAGDWPGTIAVPTGCGKTSVIDVAVFALAAQAGIPAMQRTARLRTFFVVDRRLVVDDVSRHAEGLAEAIQTKAELQWVKDQLLRFGGACALRTAVLRGGMYRSDTESAPGVRVNGRSGRVAAAISRLRNQRFAPAGSRRPGGQRLTDDCGRGPSLKTVPGYPTVGRAVSRGNVAERTSGARAEIRADVGDSRGRRREVRT